MFGMGLTEILLVGIVILLLFSPKELPGMIKSVARFYGSLRRTAEDFRAQVMETEELRDSFDEIREVYQGTRAQLAQAQGAARRELAKARLEARMAEQRLVRLAREEGRLEEAAGQKPAIATGAASGLTTEDPATDDLATDDPEEPGGGPIPAGPPRARLSPATPPATPTTAKAEPAPSL